MGMIYEIRKHKKRCGLTVSRTGWLNHSRLPLVKCEIPHQWYEIE